MKATVAHPNVSVIIWNDPSERYMKLAMAITIFPYMSTSVYS